MRKMRSVSIAMKSSGAVAAIAALRARLAVGLDERPAGGAEMLLDARDERSVLQREDVRDPPRRRASTRPRVEPTSSGTPAAEPRCDRLDREPRQHLAVDHRLRAACRRAVGIGLLARRPARCARPSRGPARSRARAAHRRRARRPPARSAPPRTRVARAWWSCCRRRSAGSPSGTGRAPSACRAACPRSCRRPTRRRSSRCSGSPPNAAMFSRTHSSAATWSSMPSLPVDGMRPFVSSRRRRKPSAPSR